MDIKKILGTLFTLAGTIGIIFGVIQLFSGGIDNSQSWIFAVLGVVFFAAGIGLLKSIRTVETTNNG